jgi:hypothetical protein
MKGMNEPLHTRRSNNDILLKMPQNLFAHLSRVEYYVKCLPQHGGKELL